MRHTLPRLFLRAQALADDALSSILGRFAGVLQVLLSHGADVTKKDGRGRTALDYAQAAMQNHCADLLSQFANRELRLPGPWNTAAAAAALENDHSSPAPSAVSTAGAAAAAAGVGVPSIRRCFKVRLPLQYISSVCDCFDDVTDALSADRLSML